MLSNFINFFDIEKEIVFSDNLYLDIINQLGGVSLKEGLFTIFKKEDIEKWNKILEETYENFGYKAKVFGYDWLGRCFGIDLREESFGDILMYEIGTAEVLEIPCDLEKFLDEEMPMESEACLAETFFYDWSNYSKQKLTYGQCAGYKVPLFLNGQDTKENLEISDMDVYWEIIRQVIKNGC